MIYIVTACDDACRIEDVAITDSYIDARDKASEFALRAPDTAVISTYECRLVSARIGQAKTGPPSAQAPVEEAAP